MISEMYTFICASYMRTIEFFKFKVLRVERGYDNLLYDLEEGYFFSKGNESRKLLFNIRGIKFRDICAMDENIEYYIRKDKDGINIEEKLTLLGIYCFKSIEVIRNKSIYLKMSNELKDDELFNRLFEDGVITGYCSKYEEVRYSDPEKKILFGNWNDVPSEAIDLLEDSGYEVEYDDEWIIDYDKDKAHKIVPSDGGFPSYIIYDGMIIDKEEALSDIEFYTDILKCLSMDGKIEADVFSIDFASSGWTKRECELTVGYHRADSDFSSIRNKAIDDGFEIIFQYQYANPFESSLCSWIRKKEDEICG